MTSAWSPMKWPRNFPSPLESNTYMESPQSITEHVPISKQPKEVRRMSLWFWGVTLGTVTIIACLGLAMVFFLSVSK